MPPTRDSHEVDELVDDVAQLTGESKAEAVRRALLERRERLQSSAETRERIKRALEFLQFEVWPLVPPDVLGQPLTRSEEERLLGYGGDE
jgi:antitoxin VapB